MDVAPSKSLFSMILQRNWYHSDSYFGNAKWWHYTSNSRFDRIHHRRLELYRQKYAQEGVSIHLSMCCHLYQDWWSVLLEKFRTTKLFALVCRILARKLVKISIFLKYKVNSVHKLHQERPPAFHTPCRYSGTTLPTGRKYGPSTPSNNLLNKIQYRNNVQQDNIARTR